MKHFGKAFIYLYHARPPYIWLHNTKTKRSKFPAAVASQTHPYLPSAHFQKLIYQLNEELANLHGMKGNI